MKKLAILSAMLLALVGNTKAQDDREHFGNTLNLGVGIGYYGYVGHAIPFGTMNYEVDVARNFTLAPFIGLYSYSNNYYWANGNEPFHNYGYRETVVPLGLKGSYYFDELFNAGDKWDFYAAASAGFNIRKRVWENGYTGDKNVNGSASPLYLNAHIGTEYHMTERTGLFLDLSTGVSTIGLGFHF
jgi:hypothetical protein